jgi:hypothetical protein
MTIQITKPALYAAAMRFAAKSEARPYLEAVAVQPRAQGGVHIISTDGHRLFVGIDEHATFHNGPAHDCLFAVHKQKAPASAFKADCLLLDGTTATFCAAMNDDTSPAIIQHVERAESIGHEWTFPNWRNVLPDANSDTVPQDTYAFNADYIADFGDIQKRLTGRKDMPFVARATGGEPALVSLGRSDCFGVLMPMRIGAAYDTGHDVALHALSDVHPEAQSEAAA